MGSTGQETDTEDIFLDYKIWGEEGNDSVMVMLQFRIDGPTGATLRIDAPGSVTLDGEKLRADSSEMTGPFYTVTRPVSEFTGNHKIVFTSADKKKFEEEFYFRPFTLRTTVSDTLLRDRTVLLTDGLDKKDFVRVLLTDTSYPGEGVNRLDTVWNNQLPISRSSISFLEPGPIHLELVKEQERPIKNSPSAGGTLSISYTIRREFYLKD